MDNSSEHSKRNLPSTARVSAKINEYFQKFAQDRDLDKFMRLYSPTSSQDSQKTRGDDCVLTLDSYSNLTKNSGKIYSTSSCEALAIMPSRTLDVCGIASSKSLPNIDVHGQPTSEKSHSPESEVIVDINIEAVEGKEKPLQILSMSTENLKTPKKSFRNIKTQTPESVAKTHRRLEWDSLGDVGYKKSMSTSNISTIERSLLREFFKENSDVSEPGTASTREEKQITQENKTVQKLKASAIEHSTPPLACSTLVITSEIGAKPKMLSQSTSSTSLHEKFEKYVQTSFIKPPTVRSQEVQCTMSSSNSVIEGTVTPSSFEYYSSRSSKSRSSKSSEFHDNTNTQKQLKSLNHPFITSITELLIKRKALSEKNQQTRHQFDNIRELQTKFQAALDENKENQSHSTVDSSTPTTLSLSKQAPELDFGIQLICALVDAKSVNGRQKKQLIRDIIRRLNNLGAEDQAEINSGGGTSTNSSDCHHQRIYNSVHSNINHRNKKGSMNILSDTSELGVSPITAEQINTCENNSASIINESENLNGSLVAREPRNHDKSKPLNFPVSYAQHQYKHNIKKSPYKNNLSEDFKKDSTKVLGVATSTISKEAQNELIMIERNNDKSKQSATSRNLSPKALDTNYSKTCKENKTNRFTQTMKPSTSTSATTTPDLTTQRFIASTNNELNNSNTDAEQPTMREWLNPLTQSEIEYEEKKQIEMKKKRGVQKEKVMKKAKHDCGRLQQLNWIENEIKRLECLKHLLLKDETTATTSTCLSSLEQSLKKDINKVSTQADKLYDTVYSDKSSILSESAEQLVQEIEIILEESHEDIVNLKDNIKSTKDRRKETQLLYGKEHDSLKNNISKTKPKFRTVNENINFQEERLLNDKKAEANSKQRQQRDKIDTPSTDKSQEPESLRDLVQQRKREFMEAYKSKKQHHYEVLKQQQREDFKYLNTQSKFKEKTSTTTDSEHYSVPHTLPTKYASNDVSHYTQHPLPLTPSEREVKLKPHNTLGDQIIHNTTSGSNRRSAKPKSHEVSTTSTNTNNTITTSSSSMFCMSSDVSVPMGSQNTSSTPTTTHQYDDVATAAAVVGVSIQTSDSILCSKPIYGAKSSLPTLIPYAAITYSTNACIQVKPKGIAYIIEFDDNKQAISRSASDIDINSHDMHTNPNTKLTNNLKPLLPTEPLLTLQDHLEKSKPKFLQHSKERKAILHKLQSMRQERDRQLREIIDNASFNSLDRRLKYLPPPPIQKVRILKTKEMKALTNKRFVSLPEVVAKHEREIEEKRRRSNRILRDIFNKRLQKRVHSGKLSLNHSKTVI